MTYSPGWFDEFLYDSDKWLKPFLSEPADTLCIIDNCGTQSSLDNIGSIMDTDYYDTGEW